VILTVTPQAMHGTGTAHTASRALQGWRVTWLGGRLLSQDQAITAMKIAMAARRRTPTMNERVSEWAGTFGMTSTRARNLAS
jgi:primosomal protein N''